MLQIILNGKKWAWKEIDNFLLNSIIFQSLSELKGLEITIVENHDRMEIIWIDWKLMTNLIWLASSWDFQVSIEEFDIFDNLLHY